MKQVLFLFDESTIMAQPWAEAGYLCFCVDLQHRGSTQNGNIITVGADVLKYEPLGPFYFAGAFTPCTDVAVSGARWFKSKGLRALYSSLGLFVKTLDILEPLNCPWFIENPVSTLATYWGKPSYTFDPCDYGDPYLKKTCLWTNDLFTMPYKKRIEPIEGSKMHRLPPGPERAKLRSKTPVGFAKAVFEANADWDFEV